MAKDLMVYFQTSVKHSVDLGGIGMLDFTMNGKSRQTEDGMGMMISHIGIGKRLCKELP